MEFVEIVLNLRLHNALISGKTVITHLPLRCLHQKSSSLLETTWFQRIRLGSGELSKMGDKFGKVLVVA